MNPARKGTALKIDLRLALASLGRPTDAIKGKSVAEMEVMLSDLRNEQIERGIIKSTKPTSPWSQLPYWR
jgi:hypothetical protein